MPWSPLASVHLVNENRASSDFDLRQFGRAPVSVTSGSPFSNVDLEAAFAGIIRRKRCGRCTATLR